MFHKDFQDACEIVVVRLVVINSSEKKEVFLSRLTLVQLCEAYTQGMSFSNISDSSSLKKSVESRVIATHED